jgi:two-component system cell cycle response regulator DivK
MGRIRIDLEAPEMLPTKNKGTVLYVEDNPDNRMLVRRILLSEDYGLLEAIDAHDALELLKTARPDLILMDINMPDMDGYTLTAKIKTMPGLERVPILALTANVMRGDKEKTLEAGCDGYIQKPIDFDELLREIEKFLARSANA